jgi:hypothetical protein
MFRRFSVAVATSREDHRPQRSGRAVQHPRWGRGRRKAERKGQPLLAHAEHHAPHAQPAADVLVDGIWSLCAHHIGLLSAEHREHTEAKPRVPVPKSFVTNLSPIFAGRERTLCKL